MPDSPRAIAGRRLKADLYGLKAEKAHVRGKMLPFVFAHRAFCCSFRTDSRITSCCPCISGMIAVSTGLLRDAYRMKQDSVSGAGL